ncbi:hypothetical protein [Pantoea sp.]|uniref:hypothetical protein n=1 Tax=Pantoea sp. TaxID=69393 RepID=UPI0039E5F0D1
MDDNEKFKPKIDAFLAVSHKGMRYAVIDDIDLFINECDDLKKDFRHTFVPEPWGTTPAEFLQLIRDKASRALKDE